MLRQATSAELNGPYMATTIDRVRAMLTAQATTSRSAPERAPHTQQQLSFAAPTPTSLPYTCEHLGANRWSASPSPA